MLGGAYCCCFAKWALFWLVVNLTQAREDNQIDKQNEQLTYHVPIKAQRKTIESCSFTKGICKSNLSEERN